MNILRRMSLPKLVFRYLVLFGFVNLALASFAALISFLPASIPFAAWIIYFLLLPSSILGVFTVIYVAVRSKNPKWLIVVLPVILSLLLFYAQGKNKPSSERKGGILTYNVGGFNEGNRRLAMLALADSVASHRIEIACFQEFLTTDSSSNVQLDSFGLMSKLPYYHFYATHIKNHLVRGLAIYSKYPIRFIREIPFATYYQSNGAILAHIESPLGKISIVNIHFQSWGKAGEKENPLKKVSSIAEKIRLRNQRLASHITEWLKVKSVLSDNPIICCDANDVPFSSLYLDLCEQRQDVWFAAGHGFGSTFSKYHVPLRIDFIFAPRQMNFSDAKVLPWRFSDHKPLITRIDFNLTNHE